MTTEGRRPLGGVVGRPLRVGGGSGLPTTEEHRRLPVIRALWGANQGGSTKIEKGAAPVSWLTGEKDWQLDLTVGIRLPRSSAPKI